MSKLICAWCGRVLNADYPTEQDGHGICPECLEREMGAVVIGGQVVELQSPAACAERCQTGQATGGID